jgi:hypothetical protein
VREISKRKTQVASAYRTAAGEAAANGSSPAYGIRDRSESG